MAAALAGSGLAVLAVDLPGHDLAAHREPFASITEVAGQVAAEIAARGLPRVMLWGHSSGAAPALETARLLQERGVRVTRVFLGAQLLGTAAERRAAVTELTARSDAEIAAGLTADSGYTELAELNERHAEHIGAAYRHDCVSAHRYFAAALETPPAVRLSAPVSVVVAADDPHRGPRRRAPGLAAPGGARRSARTPRRGPHLPAHPSGRGGPGRAGRRRPLAST